MIRTLFFASRGGGGHKKIRLITGEIIKVYLNITGTRFMNYLKSFCKK